LNWWYYCWLTAPLIRIISCWTDDITVDWQLGREVLDEAAKAVAVGVTTDEIDRIVHEVRDITLPDTDNFLMKQITSF